MRRAFLNARFIVGSEATRAPSPQDGQLLVGVDLGHDATNEHERGIVGIRQALGIPGKPAHRSGGKDLVGLDVRAVTIVSNELGLFPDLNGYAYLIFSPSLSRRKPQDWTAESLNRLMDIPPYGGEDLETAWSDTDFGIRVKRNALTPGLAALEQLYTAFKKKDIVIFLDGRNNIFGARGLVIAIRSLVPEDLASNMKEADERLLNSMDAARQESGGASHPSQRRDVGLAWLARLFGIWES